MRCASPRRALLALVALLFSAAFAPSGQAAWVAFHGDAIGTGASDATHAGYAEVWWTDQAPNGAGLVASPVVADGLVVIADTAGLVRVLEAPSGAQVWSAKMPGAVEGTPVIAVGNVYVVDVAGNLKAFDLRTGAAKGSTTAGATRGSLAEHEGVLVIGNEAGEVRAFLADLSPLWTYKTSSIKPDNAANATACKGSAVPAQPIRGRPAIFGGSVFVGSLNHYVIALDEAGSGDLKTTVKWIHRTGGLVDASPTIVATEADDLVVVGSYDGNLYAFSAHPDGEGESACFGAIVDPVWTYGVPAGTTSAGTLQLSKIHSSAAAHDGRIVVGSNGGQVVALDDGGELLWNRTVGPGAAGVGSSPAINDAVVLLGSDDGHVAWLAPANGTELARFEAGARVAGSPALDGEVAFIASADGAVRALGPARPPAPDLVVRKVDAKADEVTVVVANVGDAASNATTVRVLQGPRAVAEIKVPALDPDEEEELSADAVLAEGKTALRAELDPDGKVVERNERNNLRDTNVTIKQAKAVDDDAAAGNATNASKGGGGSKFLGIPSLSVAWTVPAIVAVALVLRRRRG